MATKKPADTNPAVNETPAPDATTPKPPPPTLPEDARAKPWRTDTLCLPCDLSNEEQRVRGQELAQTIGKKEGKEAEAKCLKDQIKDDEEKITTLRLAVEYKRETRPVTCILVPDFKAATVTTFRADTGAFVTVRALEMSERQQKLLDDNGNPTDAAKAVDRMAKAAGPGGSVTISHDGKELARIEGK